MRVLVIVALGVVAAVNADVPRTGLPNIIENYNHSKKLAEDEDANLKVPQLVRKYGYPFEDHYVTTDDGYVLNIHRIPYGRKGPSENRPAVFVMHGLLGSSADWLVAGPELGLGYVLANNGYDVWMGNARGNTYSRKHITYDPDKDKEEFWSFSWNEIGMYDLPEMIDYALEQTGQLNLFYIGHSQGTTAFYVMAAERPDYNEKIRAQFSLAPVAYMDHMTSPMFQFISWFIGPIEVLLDLIGVYEFFPHDELIAKLSGNMCDDKIGSMVCSNILFVMCGFDKEKMNTTLLPIIMGHTPAGSSTRQLLHYGQEIRSDEFRKYDFGSKGNKAAYGDKNPPNYALEKITAPVYLFYSHNDWLTAEKDVLRLYDRLPNVQGKFLVSYERWNHLDYLWGIDADKLVYNKVLSLMNKH